jgi:PEP-CTERM motif
MQSLNKLDSGTGPGEAIMTSFVKVGIVASVVLSLVTGFAGVSRAGFVCSATSPCSVQIDDLTETPTARVTQGTFNFTVNPAPTAGETLAFSFALSPTATPGTQYSDLFEDKVGGTLSDRVLVTITSVAGTTGISNVFVTFVSDPSTTTPPAGATLADALVENGSFQDLPILLHSFGPSVTSFQVRSDVETVPEPSTLLLLGGPLAALVGAAWRRRR